MSLHCRTALARNVRGLTLLEIMLALAITAIVMSVVYSTLRVSGDSLKALSVRNELYRASYALLTDMGQELASAYLSPHGAPLNGRATTYFYVEDREEDAMPQDRLFFTTVGHALTPMALGESDQAEVCYSAHYSPTREELVLLKLEDLTLDETTCKDDPPDAEDLNKDYAELPVPVATGVHPDQGTGYRLVGFQVSCFTGTAEDEEPVEEWDSVRRRGLPSRVRFTLTYRDAGGTEYPFSKTVLLRLMGAETQAPQQPRRQAPPQP